ncbi:MAG: hypothetical protein LBS45_11235, partial [Synergistaceae bacterium]|nr:hypothetical protein [Synergistaceae bacterium]
MKKTVPIETTGEINALLGTLKDWNPNYYSNLIYYILYPSLANHPKISVGETMSSASAIASSNALFALA